MPSKRLLCACSGKGQDNGSSRASSDNSSAAQTPVQSSEDQPATYTLMAKVGGDQGDWSEYWIFQIKHTLRYYSGKPEISPSPPMICPTFSFPASPIPMWLLTGRGVLLALNDYINEEYTPAIVKAFNEYGEAVRRSMTYPDGHIYNLKGLNLNERELAKSRWFNNTDWAGKLNIPQLSNLDEYYHYFKAVKDGDPNGNGVQDEIPMSGIYNTYYDNVIPILTAFGFSERRLQERDGK